MLTKHNYQNLPQNWDEGRIDDCCTSEPEDPKCGDCCYDTWTEELKDVTKRYDQVNEDAQQIQVRLGFMMDRRSRYKTWKDELEKGEELARKICHQLEIIAGQSEKIWYNSCKAAEAIRILFCMLRDFYTQVDYLKARYDELQNCINHNHDSSLVKGKGILKCLDEYYAKLDAVIKTRDALITLILDAIKLSELIRNGISTKCCPGKNDEYDPCSPSDPCNCNNCNESEDSYYGFKTIICEWYCAFGCHKDCKPCNDPGEEPAPQYKQQGQQQQKKDSNGGNGGNGGDGGSDDPCGCEKCKLEPEFDFPICNDSYKCSVDEWYDDDDACVKKLETELRDKTKEKEALLACKTSLQKAIAEVDPKTRCN